MRRAHSFSRMPNDCHKKKNKLANPTNTLHTKLNQQTQMDQQFRAQQSAGFSEEGEADTVKRMFLETNPILLGITMVVSG